MTLQIKSLSQYHSEYKRSVDNPEEFWADQASSFEWHQKWTKVLQNDFYKPDVKW